MQVYTKYIQGPHLLLFSRGHTVLVREMSKIITYKNKQTFHLRGN